MPLHVQLLEGVPIDGGSFLTTGSDKRGEERQKGTRQLRVLRSLVRLRPVEAVVRLEVLTESEVGRQTGRLRVLVVQRGVHRGGQRVLHPAIALAAGEPQADAGDAHLGQFERELIGLGAVVAKACRRRTAPLAGGLAGDEVHRTSQRIAAIERALRAAEHFDALQIHHVEHRTLRLTEVDAVEIHANGGVPEQSWVGLHTATDGDLRGRGVTRSAGHGEVGGQRVE